MLHKLSVSRSSVTAISRLYTCNYPDYKFKLDCEGTAYIDVERLIKLGDGVAPRKINR